MQSGKENIINETISHNLKIIRKNTYNVVDGKNGKLRKRITQMQVAKELGVTFQQIQKYEKNKNTVSASKLKVLADYFEVPIQDLYEPIGTYNRDIIQDESIV